MDWNSLKIFLAIAESGSLAGAARTLGVNHSTIFRRLNAFEKEVGGRVFERLNQGYVLTPTGEALLGIARRIADSFDDLQRRMVGQDYQPRGLVKITAPNNIAYRYLPRYLASWRALYPEIRIEILASNLEFNMNSRQADIALRATPSPPQHLVGRKLRDIHWSVYAGRGYAEQHGVPDGIEQLQSHRLIGASAAMSHLPGFVWLDKNLPAAIYSRGDDLVTMSCMAEYGHGLAFLPDDQQRPQIMKLFAFEPGDKSELWILTHPDLRHVERIKLVMQHLTQCFLEETAL